MNIFILGANGKVGSRVAHELIARGHTVIAGIHTQKNNIPKEATTTKIDITDQASLAASMAGADTVVCALSSWHASHHNVLSIAMHAVIPAMHQAGVTRIISISGDAARVPGETSSFFTRLFHLVAFGVVKQIVLDSEDHVRQLYESDLDWTVLRPTTMTAAPNPNYKLQQTHPASLFIPRAAVVASIADLVESGDHVHEAPFIST